MKRTHGILLVCALMIYAGCAVVEAADTKAPTETPAAKPAKPARPVRAAKPKADPDVELDMAKVSYCIGLSIGRNFNQQGMDNVDVKALTEGIGIGLAGETPKVTDEEVRETLMAFQVAMTKRQQQKMKDLAAKNRKAEEEFMVSNAKREGVKQTESGLQYEVITAGEDDAKSPTDKDTVVVNYKGMLLDGTEFDSSYSRGQPAEFAVRGVVPGWTEALQLMKVGDKWKLFIPSKLAYGARGAGRGRIGPDAMLIFEVELVDVKEKPEPKSAPVAPPAPKAAPKAEPKK